MSVRKNVTVLAVVLLGLGAGSAVTLFLTHSGPFGTNGRHAHRSSRGRQERRAAGGAGIGCRRQREAGGARRAARTRPAPGKNLGLRGRRVLGHGAGRRRHDRDSPRSRDPPGRRVDTPRRRRPRRLADLSPATLVEPARPGLRERRPARPPARARRGGPPGARRRSGRLESADPRGAAPAERHLVCRARRSAIPQGPLHLPEPGDCRLAARASHAGRDRASRSRVPGIVRNARGPDQPSSLRHPARRASGAPAGSTRLAGALREPAGGGHARCRGTGPARRAGDPDLVGPDAAPGAPRPVECVGDVDRRIPTDARRGSVPTSTSMRDSGCRLPQERTSPTTTSRSAATASMRRRRASRTSRCGSRESRREQGS